MKEIDEIFSRADARRESGIPLEEQVIDMGVDILDCVENSQDESIVTKIMFNMFDRYK